MEMSGERTIAASPAEVWAALNDPEVLKAAIPGCEEIEKTSPTEFTAVVAQKIGPVRARFTGEVELTDIVEGESYRISGRGKGGAAGGATGGAVVRLAPVAEGTHLAYEAEAKVTGKIAQLGSRLISGVAKKLADQFFDNFKEHVEGTGSEKADASAADVAESIEATSRGVASDMAEVADNATAAIADGARTVAGAAAGVAGAAVEGLASAAGDAAGHAKEHAGRAAEHFDEVSDSIDKQTRDLAGQIGSVTDKVTSAIGDAADSAYESARDTIKDLTEEGEDGKSKIDRATEDLDKQTRDVAKDVGSVVDRVTEAIEDTVEHVAKSVSDSPPAKKSFWRRLFGG